MAVVRKMRQVADVKVPVLPICYWPPRRRKRKRKRATPVRAGDLRGRSGTYGIGWSMSGGKRKVYFEIDEDLLPVAGLAVVVTIDEEGCRGLR